MDAEIVEDDYDDGVVIPILRQAADDPPKKRNPMTPPKHIREGLGLI